MSWREDATPEEQLALWEQQVRSITPAHRPAFLHLFVWNWGATLPLLRDLLGRLGDEYVAVRPDHLVTLYLQAMEREQVLVRAPERLAVLGEGRVVFALQVRNTSKGRLQVALHAAAGLQGARLEPAQLELDPAQSVTVRVEGEPRAEMVQIALQGAFGMRQVQVPVVQVRREEVLGELPATERAELAAFYEAEALSHLSGEEVADPAASSAKAWSAVRGRARAGHIVFGPYAGMPAGRYLVLFRLKRLGDGQGTLAKLDTCVGGGSPVTAERVVRVEELPPGEYRYLSLVSNHPGGAFETRVEWLGGADVVVDHISVWRLP